MHSVSEFDHYQRLAVGGTVCISQCGSCYDTNYLMQNLLWNVFGFKIIFSFNSRLSLIGISWGARLGHIFLIFFVRKVI